MIITNRTKFDDRYDNAVSDFDFSIPGTPATILEGGCVTKFASEEDAAKIAAGFANVPGINAVVAKVKGAVFVEIHDADVLIACV
jgi:hypothetical protein